MHAVAMSVSEEISDATPDVVDLTFAHILPRVLKANVKSLTTSKTDILPVSLLVLTFVK